MILEKDQIYRYMRHIIMPEIGGPGQKSLMESSVLVHCESLSSSALLLLYLAAMGIGRIHCTCHEAEDKEGILSHIKALNPLVDLSVNSAVQQDFDAAVVLGEKAGLGTGLDLTAQPVIFAAAAGNRGYIRSVKQSESLEDIQKELDCFYGGTPDYLHSIYHTPNLLYLGCLVSIEVVKTILGIGSSYDKALQYDLGSYDYVYDGSISATQQNDHHFSESMKKTLKESKALIIGSGGLGSPAAYTLAKLGIGTIGLVDYDVVDISNLNRQILHTTDRIGMPKVESAATLLRQLNPDVLVNTYEEKFSLENADSLVTEYDIVIDGLDNLPTRYLLNDVCHFLKKPLVEAGVLGFNGLVTSITQEGPCYRCTFPETLDDSPIPSCSETGVLGAVPGAMGVLQAIEVLKHLTNLGTPLVNRLLQFDALNADITVLEIYKEPSCALCGSQATIHELKEYEFICRSRR